MLCFSKYGHDAKYRYDVLLQIYSYLLKQNYLELYLNDIYLSQNIDLRSVKYNFK